MGYTELIKSVFDTPIINDQVMWYCEKKIVSTSTMIVGGFLLIAMGWNYLQNSLKLNGKIFSLEEFARCMLLIGVINVYVPLFYSVKVFANLVSYMVRLDDDDFQKYQDHLTARTMNLRQWTTRPDSAAMINNNGNPEPSKVGDNDKYYIESTATHSNWFDGLNIFGSVTGGIGSIINSFFVVLNSIIMIVIVLFVIPLSQILFVVGPLAFAFSVLPFMKDQFITFINAYLGTLFVFVTLNIIQALEYMSVHRNFADLTTNWSANQDGNLLNELAFNLSQTMVYISCFWLTSKYVGRADIGKPGKEAVQTAAQLAQLGFGNMKGGLGDFINKNFPSAAENSISTAKEAKTT